MRGIAIGVVAGAAIWTLVIGGCCQLRADEPGYWTVEYTPASLPRMHQQSVRGPYGSFWNHQRTSTGPQGWPSNPNLLEPWRAPAGTGNIADRVQARRILKIPQNSWVEVWRENQKIDLDLIYDASGRFVVGGSRTVVGGNLVPLGATRPVTRWEFPVGTIVEETLAIRGNPKPFADRSREKLGPTNWGNFQETIHWEPRGYVQETKRCAECHNDAGKRVEFLAGHFAGREWYGHVSGDDTVITWRPVDPRNRIRPEFKSFTRWKQTVQQMAAGGT